MLSWWGTLTAAFVCTAMGWVIHRLNVHDRPRESRFDYVQDEWKALCFAGAGLIFLVATVAISPWWAWAMYVAVLASVATIGLEIRHHKNDLATFLSTTPAEPIPPMATQDAGWRPYPRWRPIRLWCLVFGHRWRRVVSTNRPTLDEFRDDYDLIVTAIQCRRCGEIGDVKDALRRKAS